LIPLKKYSIIAATIILCPGGRGFRAAKDGRLLKEP
jgi:hypothetical protein